MSAAVSSSSGTATSAGSAPAKSKRTKAALRVGVPKHKNTVTRSKTEPRAPRYVHLDMTFDQTMQSCSATICRDENWFAEEFDLLYKYPGAGISLGDKGIADDHTPEVVAACKLLWQFVPEGVSNDTTYKPGSGANKHMHKLTMAARREFMAKRDGTVWWDPPLFDGCHHGPTRVNGKVRFLRFLAYE